MKWLPVIAWSLLIFATIPLAESIRQLVAGTVGPRAFVSAAVIFTAVTTCVVLVRARLTAGLGMVQALTLVGIAALFVAAIVRLSAFPQEAMHFIEYGVLSALAYRALARPTLSRIVYPTAFMLGAVVAMLDEGLQWITPGRYWDLRDIGLNLIAMALVQLALAFGITPADAHLNVDARSLRRFVRMTAAAGFLLALSMLNTPAHIHWYSSRQPALSFLANGESAMFEYGYYYDDPKTGSFKSRLAPVDLAAADRLRGKEVGALIDLYDTPLEYADILRIYPPVTDAFVHEVRVHLLQRDRHLGLAFSYPEASHDRMRCATIAASENRILEKYFGNTLAHSSFVLEPRRLEAMQAQQLPERQQARAIADAEYAASRKLVTAVTERQLLYLFGLAAIALLVVDRRLSAAMKSAERLRT